VTLLIGTSGWSYPEWKPAFYPADVPQRDFLSHYATRFTACEVNGTYYRLPTTETTARWAASTPPAFRFCIKATRPLVQGRVEWTASTLLVRDRLLDALEPLGERLATVVLRYPDGVPRDDARLETILRAWDAGAPPLVFDFHDPSWFHADVLSAIADHGHTVSVNETAGDVPETLPPGSLTYVRLRGEHYDDVARDAWLDAGTTAALRGPTFLIGRHADIPAGDPHAGVGLVDWMVRTLDERAAR